MRRDILHAQAFGSSSGLERKTLIKISVAGTQDRGSRTCLRRHVRVLAARFARTGRRTGNGMEVDSHAAKAETQGVKSATSSVSLSVCPISIHVPPMRRAPEVECVQAQGADTPTPPSVCASLVPARLRRPDRPTHPANAKSPKCPRERRHL